MVLLFFPNIRILIMCASTSEGITFYGIHNHRVSHDYTIPRIVSVTLAYLLCSTKIPKLVGTDSLKETRFIWQSCSFVKPINLFHS
jgi:hypothetical protein